MNCNDRFSETIQTVKDKGISVSIPVHKIVNWYRDWRIRKNQLEIDHIREYDDVVRDYRQDL